MVLIAHHGKDQDDGAGRMRSGRLGEVVRQDPGGSGIMCAIQQDRRILIDHFQSPVPIDRTQTSPYRFSRDRNPLRGCRLQER